MSCGEKCPGEFVACSLLRREHLQEGQGKDSEEGFWSKLMQFSGKALAESEQKYRTSVFRQQSKNPLQVCKTQYISHALGETPSVFSGSCL